MNKVKKLGLLAALVCVFSSAVSVNAVDIQKPVSAAAIQQAVDRLKNIAKDVKDPAAKKMIRQSVRNAEFLAQAGNNASPDKAQKAFTQLQKLLAFVNAKKTQDKISHKGFSSSSSSSSCDACHAVSEVASEVKECCQEIQSLIQEIIISLGAESPCDSPIAINTVPIVISESGKYCVTRDLTYPGALAAITVTADNVTINFHNHSLTLTNNAAVGVLATDVSEFTLENDVIEGSAVFQTDTSAAIHLVGVHKATLQNLYTKNTTKGIWIENSTDVKVQNCLLEAHESSNFDPGVALLASSTGNGAGMWISASSDVTVDACVFKALELEVFPDTRRNSAFRVVGLSNNISLTNSNFIDWLSTLNILKVDGFLVDHCQALANPLSQFHLVQLGDCSEGSTANDIIIRNSQFKNNPAIETGDFFFDGMLLLSGSGCLLENVILDIGANGSAPGYTPGAFHVGLGDCGTYTDALVRNSVFTQRGSNCRAVLINSGRSITIEDSQLTSSTNLCVEMNGNAESCTIKNSVVDSDRGGITINTSGGRNAIMNCQVTNGAGTGVGIDVFDNLTNHISGNSVFGFEIGIRFSVGSINEAYFNTACNNNIVDCENVGQAQVPGASPAVAGSNVCCTSSQPGL